MANNLTTISDEQFQKFRYSCAGRDIPLTDLYLMISTIFPQAKTTTLGDKRYKIFSILMAELIQYNPDFSLKLIESFPKTLREIYLALQQGERGEYDYSVRIIPYDSFPFSYHSSLKICNENQMLRFKGRVNKVSQIYSKPSHTCFVCDNCKSELKIPFKSKKDKDKKRICHPCTETRNENLKDERKFRDVFFSFSHFENDDFQCISFQESDDTIPNGEFPLTLSGEIKLCRNTDDFMKNGLIGKEVDIVGYHKIDDEKKEFDIYINNIIPISDIKLTEADIETAKKIIAEPDFEKKICEEIAGEILGLDKLKELILMSFIGLKVERKPCFFHILIVGDFGVGKTETLDHFVKYLKRGAVIRGSGISEVGLLGTVSKNPVNEKWEYTAGALLLNKGGVLGLDEKDKMTEQVSDALHTVSSDGIYSIIKAGFPDTSFSVILNLICCANPKSKYLQMGGDEPIRNQIEETASMIDRYAIIVYIPISIWSKATRINDIWKKIIQKNSGNPSTNIIHYGKDAINTTIDYLKELPNPLIPPEIEEYIHQELLKIEKKFSTNNNIVDEYQRQIGLSGRNIRNITILTRIRAKLKGRKFVQKEDVDWVLEAYSELMWNYEYQNFGGLNKYEDVYIQSEKVPVNKMQKEDIIFEFIKEHKKDGADFFLIKEHAEGFGIKENETEKIIENLNRKGDIFYDRDYKYRPVR
jgi:DNA replicative helicase MCM subunit Mcm2 (Cdc46/Mcm family)